MLKYINKPVFILLLVAFGLFFPAQNPVCAMYEVINAKTVGNENIEKEVKSDYMPTYNDPELPNFSQEDSISSKIEKKAKTYFNKRKKNSKTSNDENDIHSEATNESTNLTAPENEEQSEKKSKTSAEQEKVSDKNKFQINADKITYDDTEGNVYAKGNIEIISKAQGVILKADDAVLDKAKQTLRLYNNVRIIKDGIEMKGEYLLVDLNEQNILMDNPTIEAYSFIIKAQEGYLIANDLQMINGTAKSSKKTEYPLVTNGFQKLSPGGALFLYDNMVDTSSIDPSRKQTYTINSKELVITSYKDHDSVLLKGSNVLYNNHKIIRNTDIEIISDKQNQVIETSAPEGGTMRNFGTYIGYGFMFRLPKGQTLKLMPALVYKSGIGVGVIGRHQSKNSVLEAGWASASSNLVLRGRYKFSDALSLRYARSAYMSEGFMGNRRPGYGAQLEYKKSYLIEDLDAVFSNGVFAGVFTDYALHDQEDAYSTTRFRYMADLHKDFLKYENKEQDLYIKFGALAQGAATIYGSGETAGVARIGPVITTKVRRWESSINYLLAGIHGDSPFIFDKYRYGKSSISLNEKFNFNNKFALGFRATVTPLKDNYENDLLTESRLYALIGPQDIKLALSYDFVRDVAHVDFMFMVGSDSAKINFEKMTTKNYDGGQEKRDFYKRDKRIKIEEKENL